MLPINHIEHTKLLVLSQFNLNLYLDHTAGLVNYKLNPSMMSCPSISSHKELKMYTLTLIPSDNSWWIL